MSAICIVNINEHILTYKQLDCLANELVSFALQNRKAVFFHTRDYGFDIIQDAKMKNYFLMSDSFLYENCGFLEQPLYDLEQETAQQTYEAFYRRYKFFEDIIALVFSYKVTCIEIYLSVDGSANSVDDFALVKSNTKNFIRDFFNLVYDFNRNILREFKTVRFIIQK